MDVASLDVARRARRHTLVAEDQFLGRPPAERHHQPRFDLLAGDGHAVVFGERERQSERAPAWYDRHLVQRIVARGLDAADSVPRFVVRGETALILLHHHALALGAEHDLVLGFLEVGHEDLIVPAAHREQRRLVHEIGQIGPRHARRPASQRRHTDVRRHRLVAHVHFENALAPSEVGRVHHDLAVEPTRAQQRGVEHVGSVRGRNEDHAVVRLEAVHLDEELVERLLPLVVSAAQAGAAMPPHGVDLVDEDDAGRMSLSLFE